MDEGRTCCPQDSETDSATLPTSLRVVFLHIPLPFSSKLTLDFLGGLEQHPVLHGLSETVGTSQDISQAALTEPEYSDHSMTGS